MSKKINGASISIKNLSLNLGNTQILENINIDVKSGEIHSIIGPNGAGKTSLVRCILGQVPFEGSIEIDVEDKLILGYVPQSITYEKTLPITVEDFLMLCYQKSPAFLGVEHNNKKLFDEILDKVGLLEKKKRLMGNLSGGELQRLLLAQAIYPTPNLLILDEPFSGVDVVAEKYFVEIIKKLKDEGITILWINHNVRQVKDCADSVSCIKRHLCFSGKTDEVLNIQSIMNIYL